MSARSTTSLLGYGLYFIDVLACLLFCMTLALVTARFGTEMTVDVDLPSLVGQASTGSELSAPAIALRSGDEGLEVFLESEAITLEELERRLRADPPPSVVVRSEVSPLSRIIGIAHGAGVLDIQLAYETRSPEVPR